MINKNKRARIENNNPTQPPRLFFLTIINSANTKAHTGVEEAMNQTNLFSLNDHSTPPIAKLDSKTISLT